MKLTVRHSLEPGIVFALVIVLFFCLGANQIAQTKVSLPARTAHVNDYAGVIDENTRQRLENTLTNLTLRSGIQFDLATVESTGDLDIFDFSRQLAAEWGVGSRTTARKSLLLVLSTKDKTVFTQFSRSVQRELPEGALGEMSQRMRALADLGRFSESISDGVQYFVGKLAGKLGFSLDQIDQTPPQTATTTTAAAPDATPRATESPAPETGAPVKVSTTREDVSSTPKNNNSSGRGASASTVDDDESEEVELTLTLPVAERVTKLKEFLRTHPKSKSRPRALELLVSAHASVGDNKLKAGDSAGGVDEFMSAISDAPTDSSDQLFSGVLSQIPMNLYLRGERPAAFKAAQSLEARFGSDPKHLLAIAGFYLGIEQGDEAARVARRAVSLAPDMAEAHHALALGLHISLRLEEAATEYKRTLELDTNSKGTRRSLADLNRAAGKAEESLALYRECLTSEPTDKAARAGVVLSLLDLGRMDEAEKEMTAALADDPRNLPLLTGAAYWFVAHNDSQRALQLAGKAVEIEPRYTWSQIALARALLGEKRPLDAERAVRFARQYGKFPTLDYELANVLISTGLYEEAADVLKDSFGYKDGQIETRLAGRIPAHAETFDELLAPERRASIFQFTPAETGNNSKILKGLLAFTVAINKQGEGDKIDEATAIAGAREFSSGDDAMRVFRQLYAADRLVKKGVALKTAYDLTEAARNNVDAGVSVPALTVAVQADEFRDIRARAIASGGMPDIPEAPRNVLSNILRGRLEDIAGWSLFNQDMPTAAMEHLKLAASVLPEGTPSWRTALWHLGTALDQAGNGEEALNYYIKSYNSGEPDPIRKMVIEQLYRKLKGSLTGLDERMNGASSVAGVAASTPTPDVTPNGSPDAGTGKAASGENPTPTTQPGATAESAVKKPAATESSTPDSSRETTPPSPTPQSSPAVVTESAGAPNSIAENPKSETTPAPDTETSSGPSRSGFSTKGRDTRPISDAQPSATPEASPAATPASTPSATPEETPAPADKDAKAESSPTPSEPSRAPTSDSSISQSPLPRRSIVKITGRIKDASNNGIGSVVVVLISPRGTVLASTTDAEGNYSFTVPPSEHNYRLIPSREGLTFTPVDKILEGLSQDQKGIDFVGASTRAP